MSGRPAGTPEVILHLGAHRTGTTLLQKVIARNRSALGERGVKAYVSGEDFCWRIRWLAENENLLRRPETARGTLQWPGGWEKILISEENVFCSAHEAPLTRLYAERTRRMEVLREMFHPCRVRVLFYLREYAGFVESCYGKYVRYELFRGEGPRSFASYIGEVGGAPEDFTWNPVLGALREVFGHDNLIVGVYESLKARGPEEYARVFFRRAGIRPEGLDMGCRPKRVNPSSSRLALRVIRWLGRWVSGGAYRRLAEVVMAVDGRAGLERPRYFEPETRKTLNELYARDCQSIFIE